MRIFTIVVLMLSLTACVGGVGPGSGKRPGDPPSNDHLYDGEPTNVVLEILVEPASAQGFAAMSAFEPFTAHVRVAKEVAGVTIFQAYFEQLITDPTQAEMPFEIPSDQGYHITLLALDDDQLVGIGRVSKFDAARGTVNTVQVEVEPISFTVDAPERYYSGGSLSQLRIKDLDPMFSHNIYFGLNPWPANGPVAMRAVNGGSGPDATSWINRGTLPQISEPTPVYYQILTCVKSGYHVENKSFCTYFPDINAGGTLPFVMAYPAPI